MTKSLAAPAQVVDKEVDAAVDCKEEVGDQGQHRAPSHLLEIHLRKVEISCGDIYYIYILTVYFKESRK